MCYVISLSLKQLEGYGHRPSLTVQCLRLCASKAGDLSLTPGWETKIPHATEFGLKKLKQDMSSDDFPFCSECRTEQNDPEKWQNSVASSLCELSEKIISRDNLHDEF